MAGIGFNSNWTEYAATTTYNRFPFVEQDGGYVVDCYIRVAEGDTRFSLGTSETPIRLAYYAIIPREEYEAMRATLTLTWWGLVKRLLRWGR